MRRNFDTIREILLQIADDKMDMLDGEPQTEILFHLELLIEAGLVDGEVMRSGSQVEPVFATVNRLTWAGHDFLEAIENPKQWEKIKTMIKEKVGTTASQVWISVAVQLAKQAIGLG